LAAAAKARDQVRLTVLRLLKTALQNYKIEVGEDLTPQQIMSVLQKEAKKHQDSIEQYKKAGRDDLVAEETAELDIIDEYLPEKISAEDLEKLVDQAIAETNASSMADMGRVMQAVNKKTNGTADGASVSALVKSKLNS
jgi:uncharacterized protein YqeY